MTEQSKSRQIKSMRQQNKVKLLISQGLALHKNEKFEKAQAIYEQVLSIEANHFDALNLLGDLSVQTKKYTKAIDFLNKALQINPHHAASYSNHGIALKELMRFEEALASFDKAISIKPDFALAYSNRGIVLKELKHFQDALASFDKAICIKADYADAHSNRGNTLQELDRYDEALISYDKAININSDYSEAYFNRGNLLKKLNRFDEAITSYENALSINPNFIKAQYELATLGVGEKPKVMPRDSVVSLFDNYADRFDDHLVGVLDYQTPTILFDQYKHYNTLKIKKLLDLGCGTGLSGDVFRNSADNMIGVDLSEGMLSKAKLKQIYTKLVCEDILHFLEKQNDKFELIICADVFVYIGELKDIFFHITSSLEEKGFFSFSIENSQSVSYELKITGRYGHGLSYIKEIAKSNNLSILDIHEINLRKDKGRFVSGAAILLQK